MVGISWARRVLWMILPSLRMSIENGHNGGIGKLAEDWDTNAGSRALCPKFHPIYHMERKKNMLMI